MTKKHIIHFSVSIILLKPLNVITLLSTAGVTNLIIMTKTVITLRGLPNLKMFPDPCPKRPHEMQFYEFNLKTRWFVIVKLHKIFWLFQDLICSPADILEPRKKGTVRVAISVSEVLRFHQPKEQKLIQWKKWCEGKNICALGRGSIVQAP